MKRIINHSSHLPENHTVAICLGVGANILLGVSSLYWRELSDVSPQTLVAYRIILSLLLLSVIVFSRNGFYEIRKIKIELLALHCLASLLVAANWTAFIWASVNGHILESGFGYLLAPLLSIAMGVFFYHESLRTTQVISIIIALCSAVLLILYSDELNHWTYIVIATTWGAYTCFKKATPLNATNGLFVETAFLSICLTLIIIIYGWAPAWPNELSTQSCLIIWLAGAISIIPLMMFASATSKIPLSMMGFFQFILPTTQLIVALLFYKQSISTISLILFVATIGALALVLLYELITSLARPKRLPK
ncbi:protein RarD [Pseudomonas sp. K2I15]|nr:protein RarD [Pseudomonas sp. K2I15]